MILDLTPDELLTTTRSVRKRLDLDRPVERSVIEECIDLAIQAPTGSNAQGWQWVVVEDPSLKRQIADYYGRQLRPVHRHAGPVLRRGGPSGRATGRGQVVGYVPSRALPRGAGDGDPVPVGPRARRRAVVHAASYWGSILPAVWSFMLALRVARPRLGMDHVAPSARAARWPNCSASRSTACTQAGLFPVAYTKGTDFKPASRVPASEIIHWDTVAGREMVDCLLDETQSAGSDARFGMGQVDDELGQVGRERRTRPATQDGRPRRT